MYTVFLIESHECNLYHNFLIPVYIFILLSEAFFCVYRSVIKNVLLC